VCKQVNQKNLLKDFFVCFFVGGIFGYRHYFLQMKKRSSLKKTGLDELMFIKLVKPYCGFKKEIKTLISLRPECKMTNFIIIFPVTTNGLIL